MVVRPLLLSMMLLGAAGCVAPAVTSATETPGAAVSTSGQANVPGAPGKAPGAETDAPAAPGGTTPDGPTPASTPRRSGGSSSHTPEPTPDAHGGLDTTDGALEDTDEPTTLATPWPIAP